MAELGSIQQTDINRGTRPIDRTSELRALDTALGVTKKVIDEGVKADVRTDLQGTLEESLDTAAEAVLTATTEADFTPIAAEGLTEEMQVVANTIRKHQAQLAQATDGNFRTRAILNIQTAAREAKIKYPWFSDEIDALTGRFEANSPELTKLGLIDSNLSSPNNLANASQDYLNELSDYAYGRGDNQLNIPASVELSSPEFARMFAARSGNIQQRIANVNEYQRLQSFDALTARKVGEFVTEGLVGSSSLIVQEYDNLSRSMSELHRIRISIAQGTGEFSTADLGAAEEFFTRATIPQFTRRFNELKVNTLRNFQAAWPANTTDQPEFTAAQKVLDQTITQIDTIIESLAANSTDAKTMLDTMLYVAGIGQLERSANLLNFTTLTKAMGKDAIQAMETMDFTFGSAWTQNAISEGFKGEVELLFPRIFNNLNGVQGVGEARDQRSNRAAERNTSNRPGGVTTGRDAVQQITDSMIRIVDAPVYFDQQPAQLDNVPTVKGILIDITAGLETIPSVSLEELPEKELGGILDTLSDPVLITMVDKIGRDNPEVQAFNIALQEDYLTSINKHSSWVKSLITQATTEPVPGVQWLQVMDMNTDGLEASGKITFTINTDLYNLTVRSKTSVSRQEAARREADAIAKDLSKDVSQYLQVMGLQDYLDNTGLSSPQYGVGLISQGGSLSLESIFKILEPVEDGGIR